MTQPQVQVFVVRSRTDVRYRWRILTRNHREVGRATAAACTPFEARQDVARVRELARQDRLRPVLSSRPAEGGWRWSLLAEAEEVAVSHRAYSRRRECVAPLQQFLQLLSEPDGELKVVDLSEATYRPGRKPLPPRPAGAPLLECVRRVQVPEQAGEVRVPEPVAGHAAAGHEITEHPMMGHRIPAQPRAGIPTVVFPGAGPRLIGTA